MGFSPCICTGSSSVMSAVLWHRPRIAMCCQNIHQRAMVQDLGQIQLQENLVYISALHILTLLDDILSSIQYSAENLEFIAHQQYKLVRIYSSKPCGPGCYEKNANKTRGTETRLGQEVNNHSRRKAKQEGGTKPSIGCSSSWIFPEMLFKLENPKGLFFQQFQGGVCLKVVVECPVCSFIHFKAVVCADRVNNHRSLSKSG